MLQSQPDRLWQIGWLRTADGGTAQAMSGTLVQARVTVTDEFGNASLRLYVGAINDVEKGEGVRVAIRGRITYAASKAVERTGDTIVEMVGGFWSIVRGETPHETVGGPLMMYRVASVSGSKGWDAFLLMLALISVVVPSTRSRR